MPIHRPDVVILALENSSEAGIRGIRALKADWPATRVVVLTMYAEHRAEALLSGADAFLLKGCTSEQLVRAIMERH